MIDDGKDSEIYEFMGRYRCLIGENYCLYPMFGLVVVFRQKCVT